MYSSFHSHLHIGQVRTKCTYWKITFWLFWLPQGRNQRIGPSSAINNHLGRFSNLRGLEGKQSHVYWHCHQWTRTTCHWGHSYSYTRTITPLALWWHQRAKPVWTPLLKTWGNRAIGNEVWKPVFISKQWCPGHWVVKLRHKVLSLFVTGPCSVQRAQLHSDANTQLWHTWRYLPIILPGVPALSRPKQCRYSHSGQHTK